MVLISHIFDGKYLGGKELNNLYLITWYIYVVRYEIEGGCLQRSMFQTISVIHQALPSFWHRIPSIAQGQYIHSIIVL